MLAGDIGVGTAGIDFAARQFLDTPVIYVPDNHEYYDHSLDLVDDLRALAPGHIHVLDNAASGFLAPRCGPIFSCTVKGKRLTDPIPSRCA